MKIEIWGDIVCPYCYIGKGNLVIALRQFAHAEDVVVLNRAFELDPRFDKRSILTVEQAAARKYGMTPQQTEAAERRLQQSARKAGLDYSIDRPTGNTFDIHRVLRMSEDFGLRNQLTETLFGMNFTNQANVFDRDTLVGLATGAGLDPVAVREVLAGDAYAKAVHQEESAAKRRGISTLPVMLIDSTIEVAGARSPQTYLKALEHAWDVGHPSGVPT
jgi:predicted DsbA family dithiol-disulfide isomerase